MSNYCILCSMHHHTKMEPRRRRRRRETGQHMMTVDCKIENYSKPASSLIDMPVCSHSIFKTPLKSSSLRHSKQRQSSGVANNQDQRSQCLSAWETDKVILAVGDSIRVAPKLGPNQKYKFASGSGASSLKTHHSTLSPAIPPGQWTRRKSSRRGRRLEDNSSHNKARQYPLASTSQAALAQNEDDILTLSLDQGDQVRVEMSSLSSLNDADSLQHISKTKIITNRDDKLQSLDNQSQKVDEFLQANKTLKSIQTITKMIVDLSSKAQNETVSSRSDLNQREASPLKLLKTGLNSSSPSASPKACHYIPPDTPVHRPRRSASSIGHSSTADRTQSVSNTPQRIASFRESSKSQLRRGSTRPKTSDNDGPSLHPDAPLPPPPPSVPFRRKLSTSAKRFFDGSLRSLTSLGGAGGYLSTSEDLDSEDCEALVERRLARSQTSSNSGRSRRSQTNGKLPNHHHCQSQPCTPLKSLRGDFSSNRKQSTIDLAQLRSQVVEKLRQSTSWMSASSASFAWPTRDNRDDSKRRSNKFDRNSQSCTKQSHWVHKSGINHTHSGYTEGSVALSSSSSSASSLDSSEDSDDEPSFSSSFSSSDDGDAETHATDKNEAFGFLDQTLRAKLFKKSSSRHSASAKDLNDLVRMSLVEDGHPHHGRLAKNSDSRGRSGVAAKQAAPSKTQLKRRRRRHHRTRKSICQNANCCCSREFKLNNRPPVWNEQSQVYQLDFGGRVTQESAKNLQIDFNGNLALQFGRIDKCTYTLDYKYPFNAVQAMSIALASLTQRLK